MSWECLERKQAGAELCQAQQELWLVYVDAGLYRRIRKFIGPNFFDLILDHNKFSGLKKIVPKNIDKKKIWSKKIVGPNMF